jgi:hypothetical protein
VFRAFPVSSIRGAQVGEVLASVFGDSQLEAALGVRRKVLLHSVADVTAAYRPSAFHLTAEEAEEQTGNEPAGLERASRVSHARPLLNGSPTVGGRPFGGHGPSAALSALIGKQHLRCRYIFWIPLKLVDQ